MYNTLFWWDVAGAIAIFFLGAFIHIGFEITNKISIFTPFFAVNESLWEHTKLTFWAPIIFSVIEYFFIGRYYPCFIFAKTCSAIITSVTMIFLFYTLSGSLGIHSLIFHLIIFEISIITGLIAGYLIIIKCSCLPWLTYISIAFIILSIPIYYILSYSPPRLPIFKCNVSGQYGIQK